MPTGIYIRKPSKKRDEATAKNFAKGRTPEAREKANITLRDIVWTEEKRKETSEKTKEIMHRPDVREKHLKALENAPVNFKGGNGQELTEVVKKVLELLTPLGFDREVGISTKGQTSSYQNVPFSYKTDFGHRSKKIALELDGVCHSPFIQKEIDKKKTEVLESLGWTVVRIKHRKEVLWPNLSAEILSRVAMFL
jgi:hypothetical protein